jgi:glycosyltransferase involved in cell wall biosynthesis
MKLDIIIPLYNEEGCARQLLEALQSTLAKAEDLECRYILVNDGSSDQTGCIIDEMAEQDTRVVPVQLWGNHGHQRAIVAGLDRADADMVLLMDGDGQHPPKAALEMVVQLRTHPHIDVVQAVRRGRQGGFIKNISSALFYRSINGLMPEAHLHPGASDFRVMRRSVVERIKEYSDRHRNLRVLLASLRLATLHVEYDLQPRISGSSGYNLRQMLGLALNGWFAFSFSPLRVSLLLMLLTGTFGLLYLGYSLLMFVRGSTVPGWTSLIVFLAFLFSGLFGVLAILAEYVARIYEDVRAHPIYKVRPEERTPPS